MNAVQVAGGIIAILGALTAIGVAIKFVGRFARRVGNLMDDLLGEPARPGVPERPGVMARLENQDDRLSTIEAQLRPNGGASLRDVVNGLKVTTEEINGKLDEHLEQHAQRDVWRLTVDEGRSVLEHGSRQTSDSRE